MGGHLRLSRQSRTAITLAASTAAHVAVLALMAIHAPQLRIPDEPGGPPTPIIPILILPKAPANAVRVGRTAFAAAVRQVAPPNGTLPSLVRLAAHGHELVVFDPGHNRNEVLEVTVRGAGLEVDFEARYLLDALAALEDGEIELATAGPMAPALLTNPGRDDVKAVVMPRRG